MAADMVTTVPTEKVLIVPQAVAPALVLEAEWMMEPALI